MDITNSTALVTGANRGIGRHFAQQLLERGATKVYAAARDPKAIDLPGVIPVQLDVTDPEQVAAAAALAGDVDLLINNAGVSLGADLISGDLEVIRREMEVNFWGSLAMTRAFAPILGANGGGAIVNVLSRISWLAFPGVGGYAASKAAAWMLTNATRLELSTQGTQVLGLALSGTDTDMMAGWDMPLNDPADVVRDTLDGLQAGAFEVLADEDTRITKADLARDPAEVYAGFLGTTA